jgi:DNA repair protein RadC
MSKKKVGEGQLTFAYTKPPTEYVKIHELPPTERPVARLRYYGTGALSTIEVIAAVIQTDDALRVANQCLGKFEGIDGMARASVDELCQIHGIGPAKAAQIKAALELGRRLLVASPHDRPQIKSPADAANLLMIEMGLLDHEQLRVVLLDTKNHVLAIETIYKGNVNSSIIRTAELFREPIRRNCAAIIVVHNHPSGDATPSPEDVRVTEQVVEAGKLLDIDVLDHLIIGQQRYVSLKERGLGFK